MENYLCFDTIYIDTYGRNFYMFSRGISENTSFTFLQLLSFKLYFRLTPSYLYLILFMMYLFPYLGNGPFWAGSTELVNCNKYIWTNLLYINNIYPDASKVVSCFPLYLSIFSSYHSLCYLFTIVTRL